jgi:PhnB protein
MNPPSGYHTVTPYVVTTNARQFVDYATAAFGATESDFVTDDNGRVIHAEIRIGDSAIMLTEGNESYTPSTAGFYLYVPDTDAVYAQAIAAGGVSTMEPADQFYGDRSGGVKDPLGNYWWIATRVETLTAEEIEQRMEQR